MKWTKIEAGDYTAAAHSAHFRVFRRTGGKWLAFIVDAMGGLVQPVTGGPFTSRFEATDACERLLIRWNEEAAIAAKGSK